jgi:anti-sigma regulatory factor (Ser/Thr protein kinase)
MKRRDLATVTSWLTVAANEAGAQLPARMMEHLGIGRRAALTLLRRLEAAQWLVHEGTPRQRIWRPGALRQVVQRYALAGLQEDLPWSRDFAPHFVLPPDVARMAQHAFTELLNNAVDHCGGTQVTVSMRQTPLQLQLLVSDDGCGLFDRIASAHGIGDPTLAMLELSKGKLSSQPERHTGRGLFFTSRLADVFDLHANASAFQYRGWDHRSWFRSRPLARQGTSVYLAIALDTPRTLDTVLRAHSLDGDGYGFDRTVVPLRLLTDGDGGALESRALARRVAARLQQFRRAELDFTGIGEIGHGFADELFRVTAHEQPTVQMVPVGAAPRVAAMIDSVRAG